MTPPRDDPPLGFTVDALLAKARGGGPLRIGLVPLTEADWLEPAPDLSARSEAFDAYPDSVQVRPEGEAASRELGAMLGVSGGIEAAARAHWEDMCLMVRRAGEDVYRLAAAAVAFPTDWRPADKMGLPLAAMHAPIDGYEEQLSTGVDRFMAKLKAGRIYGRSNWFVVPDGGLRHLPAEDDPGFEGVTTETAGVRLFVRCERQTLRRLPETGAILFTIGVHLEPVGNAGLAGTEKLVAAVASLPEGERRRRGADQFEAALRGYAAKRGCIVKE